MFRPWKSVRALMKASSPGVNVGASAPYALKITFRVLTCMHYCEKGGVLLDRGDSRRSDVIR